MALFCCTDYEKKVIVSNFKKRGWISVDKTEWEWNFYWACTATVHHIFSDPSIRLEDDQLLNHFPNHYELTRKDTMVKNIKRYIKEKERSGFRMPPVIPSSFVLPSEYMMFVEEFKKHPKSIWILKPPARACGEGIVIVTKLSQLTKWNSNRPKDAQSDTYMISRYVSNPLTIGGRKFDLRLYVLVTSFSPLKAYLYKDGFARFCNVEYSNSLESLADPLAHLTNVAVQKHGPDYCKSHGGKWTLDNLMLYLSATKGQERTDTLKEQICELILVSLKAVQGVIISDRHCFELYGYDLLIDDELRVWLIEVNASPSLSTTGKADQMLKTNLISDVINIVTNPTTPRTPQGNFRLLHDDSPRELVRTPRKMGRFFR